MDNELLRLIARLKIAAARNGQTVDVVRFVADKVYARTALSRFTDGADEDGILLALQVLDRMGLSSTATGDRVVPLSVAKPPSASAVAEADVPAVPKYVGNLRG